MTMHATSCYHTETRLGSGECSFAKILWIFLGVSAHVSSRFHPSHVCPYPLLQLATWLKSQSKVCTGLSARSATHWPASQAAVLRTEPVRCPPAVLSPTNARCLAALGPCPTDVLEVQRLAGLTSRPLVAQRLQALAQTMAASILPGPPAAQAASAAPAKPGQARHAAPSTPAVPPPRAPDKLQFKHAERYGWDQSDKYVSVYVPVPGVAELPADRVSCKFTPRSFDLRVVGQDDGTHVRLLREPLEHEIDSAGSKLIVKQDKVVVKLRKAKAWDHWSSRGLLADPRAAAADSLGESPDPGAGLLDVVRRMYEDGDVDMKRVIGEAMTKPQSNPDFQ